MAMSVYRAAQPPSRSRDYHVRGLAHRAAVLVPDLEGILGMREDVDVPLAARGIRQRAGPPLVEWNARVLVEHDDDRVRRRRAARSRKSDVIGVNPRHHLHQ